MGNTGLGEMGGFTSMVKSFCKDCPNRHAICHDTCEKYQKYKQELAVESSYNRAMTGSIGVYHRGYEDRHREKGRKRYMGANGGADR
jgi:hypothetical protein